MLDPDKFEVSVRTKTGKSANRKLRATKGGVASIPGVVYGTKNPVNVYMRSDLALRFIKSKSKSEHKQFDLEIKDENNKNITRKVIIQDYQISPLGNRLIHVDFREVTSKSIITSDVPITTIGTSKAVKEGGIVQIIRHSIQVRGQVDKIPSKIEVDITKLDFGENIHASDLVLPAGITPVLAKDEDFAIITITTASIEEEVTATEAESDAEAKTPTSPEEAEKKPSVGKPA